MPPPIVAHKGLVGAIQRSFARPELWLIRCVMLAAIIAVVYFSSEKAKDAPTQAILICIGLAAVGFHYLGAQKACAAWFERKAVSFILWGLVVAGAITWEFNSQLSVSSNNQDNLRAARMDAHHNRDTAVLVENIAKGKLARIDERLKFLENTEVNGRQIRTPDAAKADIQNAEAHRFFKMTAGCTDTKGPDTRKFCTAYASFKSELALTGERETLKAERETAVERLTEATAAVKATAAVTSSDRADTRNLKRLTGLSDADVELSQSLLVVAVIALFLTVAGWLIKAEQYEGKQLKPWFTWNWARRLYASITGQEYTGGNTITHVHGLNIAQMARLNQGAL